MLIRPKQLDIELPIRKFQAKLRTPGVDQEPSHLFVSSIRDIARFAPPVEESTYFEPVEAVDHLFP